MKNILSLIKRNCLLFIRSSQVVLSSLMSGGILIILYFLFIANLYSNGFNEATGLMLTSKQINAAIYTQMIMGVLVINSISLSTGMFTFMARDLETRKTEAFLLTKAKPFQIAMSYLISAIIVSYAINFLILVISFIVIGILTGVWISFLTFLAVSGVLIIVTLAGCAIMLFITSIVRSSVAVGVISGLIGTILGFLCGIYMPYSNMGKGAMYVGSFLPITHFVIWLKQIALGDILSQFGINNELSKTIQKEAFSASNIGLCGANLPLWLMIVLGIVFSIGCFILSMFIISRLYKNQKNNIKQVNKKD